jgi:hypothetical protein
MYYVVGEASECALATREEDFDFVGSRVLLYAFEDVCGFVASKHSALSIQHFAIGT